MKPEHINIDIKSMLYEYNKWIAITKQKYSKYCLSINDSKLNFVNTIFPQDIIHNVLIAIIDDFPFPPFEKMGFPDLAYWNNIKLAGITYGDLIFTKKINEPTIFHELIHISQKYFIGYDIYHTAYAQYVIKKGYATNPFEIIAYKYEKIFTDNELEDNFVDNIKNESLQAMANIEEILNT